MHCTCTGHSPGNSRDHTLCLIKTPLGHQCCRSNPVRLHNYCCLGDKFSCCYKQNFLGTHEMLQTNQLAYRTNGHLQGWTVVRQQFDRYCWIMMSQQLFLQIPRNGESQDSCHQLQLMLNVHDEIYVHVFNHALYTACTGPPKLHRHTSWNYQVDGGIGGGWATVLIARWWSVCGLS